MKRVEWIDISKAIGIIFVVFAHALTKGSYLSRIIQQFHMPLFFFLSGYLFKENNITLKYITKKIRTLWFPYFIANFISIILIYNSFIIIIKKIIKTIFMISVSNDLFGAMWFLSSLFYISIVIQILYTIIRKMKIKLNFNLIYFAIMIIFIVGFLSPGRYHIGATLIGTAFYLLGYVCRKINLIEKIKKLDNLKILFIFLICLSALLLISSINYVSVSKNIYTYPLLFVISSFSGIICIIILSLRVLNGNKILMYIGNRTMSILIWHFVAFKLVILLQIIIYKLPISVIYYHPYYDNSGIWLLLLLLFGLIVPILISNIFKLILKKIKQ